MRYLLPLLLLPLRHGASPVVAEEPMATAALHRLDARERAASDKQQKQVQSFAKKWRPPSRT
jgi:hypothetical protein